MSFPYVVLMQGALYYPYIGVPDSVWLTRTLLYWDYVATITPAPFRHDPERHDWFTRDLVHRELIFQVFPDEAEEVLPGNFERFVHLQSDQEVSRRRSDFELGQVARIHGDKIMHAQRAFASLVNLGLASRLNWEWYLVERATAEEFMAALAFSLCEAAGPHGWHRTETPQLERWVPVTDTPSSARALLSGLRPAGADGATKLELRVHGELQVSEVRSALLEELLPVPAAPMDVEQMLAFRRKYGGQLPAFRRELERRIRALADIQDPVRYRAALDDLRDGVYEETQRVESYLKASKVRAVVRSPLVTIFKLIPGIKGQIDAAQDLMDGGAQAGQGFDALSYLAFANAAFAPHTRYITDPRTGMPLVEVMSRAVGERRRARRTGREIAGR